ncbi:WecB/TagA/CpsF family glycosyltransferase [Microbulbifer magnicolonia]|uniref:WecB/TagA/CpsF family glycosyltransferase n=1 Tax=Microbulbifer magnicolonia TaxID=3109744 RepID=UPI002B418370|nr:WecB/TagA/CpsF family glycosyltransferase [Microbulbifer sp. GG15]
MEQSQLLTNRRIDLNLCHIDAIKMSEAIEQIRTLARSSAFHYVVTPNIDHLQRLYKAGAKSEICDIYRNASLSLCDSRILEKLMELSGARVPQVVTGSDLTRRMFDEVLKPGSRLFIVGGSAALIDRLRNLYPYLQIEHVNPSMGFIKRSAEVCSVVDAVCAAKPEFILLAVGSPQQEILARKLAASAKSGVALCIGASLLFITGEEKRAPEWLQTLRCEWLYRLSQCPRRMAKRYLLNMLHLPFIAHAIRKEVHGDGRKGAHV